MSWGPHKTQGIFLYISAISTTPATAATRSKKSPNFVITDENEGMTSSCNASRQQGGQVSRVLRVRCGSGCLLVGGQETLAQVWENLARKATRLTPPTQAGTWLGAPTGAAAQPRPAYLD